MPTTDQHVTLFAELGIEELMLNDLAAINRLVSKRTTGDENALDDIRLEPIRIVAYGKDDDGKRIVVRVTAIRNDVEHTCARCGRKVAFAKGYWWSSHDDFNCPDGEELHAPTGWVRGS